MLLKDLENCVLGILNVVIFDIKVDKNLVNMWIIYAKSLKQPSPSLRGLECEPITPDWIKQKRGWKQKKGLQLETPLWAVDLDLPVK